MPMAGIIDVDVGWFHAECGGQGMSDFRHDRTSSVLLGDIIGLDRHNRIRP